MENDKETDLVIVGRAGQAPLGRAIVHHEKISCDSPFAHFISISGLPACMGPLVEVALVEC